MEINNKHLITASLFKQALLKILLNNEGIILKVNNDIKPLYPGQDKILIFKYNNEIKIMNYDGDLKDGEIIDIEFIAK